MLVRLGLLLDECIRDVYEVDVFPRNAAFIGTLESILEQRQRGEDGLCLDGLELTTELERSVCRADVVRYTVQAMRGPACG